MNGDSQSGPVGRLLDAIRVTSVSRDGEVVLGWPGGSVRLSMPRKLAHYYRRLVSERTTLPVAKLARPDDPM